MDIKSIKHNINEILKLSKSGHLLNESWNGNFKNHEGPELIFREEYDGESEEYYGPELPPHESRNKPEYLSTEEDYVESGLYSPYACLVLEFGYYDGACIFIKKNDDIYSLVHNEAYEDENGYVYGNKSGMTEDEIYAYMQTFCDAEFKKGYEELIKLQREYGGELVGIPKEYISDPEEDGSGFDYDDEIEKIVQSAKL